MKTIIGNQEGNCIEPGDNFYEAGFAHRVGLHPSCVLHA